MSTSDDAALPEDLLAILVCPVDRGELRPDGVELVCSACRRRYPIVDGIPHLVIEAAVE